MKVDVNRSSFIFLIIGGLLAFLFRASYDAGKGWDKNSQKLVSNPVTGQVVSPEIYYSIEQDPHQAAIEPKELPWPTTERQPVFVQTPLPPPKEDPILVTDLSNASLSTRQVMVGGHTRIL